jgi:hypothetical protein
MQIFDTTYNKKGKINIENEDEENGKWTKL